MAAFSGLGKSLTVAERLAEMADRQRIEQAYAQGSTQVYAQSLQANSSVDHGIVMDFFIPAEMRIINKVLAKIRLNQFRAYSKATTTVKQEGYTYDIEWNTNDIDDYGNVEIISSEAGAVKGKVQAVTSYGNGNPSGFKVYTGIGIKSNNIVEKPHWDENLRDWVYYDCFVKPYHDHKHKFEEATHRHGGFVYPAHQHSYVIPAHKHGLTLPTHRHGITPGIYKFGNPRSFRLFVDGRQKAAFASTNAELDITDFLLGDDDKIPRGKWFALEVRPDSLAYVSIVLMMQGFIQSRGVYNA